MEPDMTPPQSWRSMAKSKISLRGAYNSISARVSDYAKPDTASVSEATGPETSLQNCTKAQTWNEWARQKIPGRRCSAPNSRSVGIEKVFLFPGWATRRYSGIDDIPSDVADFDLEILVSGFTSSLRPPELATRSQRAFMRIARGFAALPKLEGKQFEDPQMPPLPPTPDEMTPELEARILNLANSSQPNVALGDESLDSLLSGTSTPPGEFEDPSQIPLQQVASPSELRLLHANLDSRLQPFWSSTLAGRSVQISIFTQRPTESESNPEPLFTIMVETNQEGFFCQRFNIPSQTLRTHPQSLGLAFGEPDQPYSIFVQADLLPSMLLDKQQTSGAEPVKISTTIATPLSQARVRVLSDIDDTIKIAEILAGVRVAFQNVFTKHLHDLVVPGMPEWYQQLKARGVAFHYVSNSPFELLTVLNDYFQVAGLPEGSLKLKFYGGRSLFRGLWAAPAERKRSGVVEVLDDFPHSKFFLIGDTGEQDLELYTDLARERPNQILGIFLRDVYPPSQSTPSAGLVTSEPESLTSSSDSADSSNWRSASYFADIPGALPQGSRKGSQASLSSQERKQKDLQSRIAIARSIVPDHVMFRVFRHPEECLDALQILDSFGTVKGAM